MVATFSQMSFPDDCSWCQAGTTRSQRKCLCLFATWKEKAAFSPYWDWYLVHVVSLSKCVPGHIFVLNQIKMLFSIREDYYHSLTFQCGYFVLVDFLTLNYICNKKPFLGWRDGSAVESIDCSSSAPRFNSQHPHGSSQLCATPGDLTPSHQWTQNKLK